MVCTLRKLDHKTLEAIRIRAMEQVEAGESPEAVIQALGIDRTCIYKWLALYHEGGIEPLKGGCAMTFKEELVLKLIKTVASTPIRPLVTLDAHLTEEFSTDSVQFIRLIALLEKEAH